MKIRVLINEERFVTSYATVGGSEDWIETDISEDAIEDLKINYNKYYLKDNELIKQSEKPDNYHIWDNKTNKWNYDKQLEIKSLNEELADLEGALLIKYDDLDKAITRKLKTLQKRLNTEIEELSLLIDEKYLKLEELEG